MHLERLIFFFSESVRSLILRVAEDTAVCTIITNFRFWLDACALVIGQCILDT